MALPEHELDNADVPKHGPHDPNEINPKLASDIHYWTKELGVTGQVLHEAIRVHGTHVAKVRAALQHHSVNMTTTNSSK